MQTSTTKLHKRGIVGTIVVIMVLAGACALFFLNWGGSSQPTVTQAPVALPQVAHIAPPTATSVPELTTTDDSADNFAAAEQYLNSPPRIARFENTVPRAGSLIAHALEAGKFSPVDRYNADKTDLTHDYVGWGGIAATDPNHTAFAWVYWNHGKIDYKQPITQISIGYPGDSSSIVTMFAPDDNTSEDGADNFWTIYNTTSGYTDIMSTISIQYGISPIDGNHRYPTNLEEIMNLDTDGFNALDLYMEENFGHNWQN